MDTETPIRLNFAYTYSDWIQAHRFYYSHSRRSKTDKIVAIVVLIIGGWFVYERYIPAFHLFAFFNIWDYLLPAFLILASIIMWFDLATMLGMRSRWNRRYGKKGTSSPLSYEFIFDESGAQFTSEGVNVRLAWTEFAKFLENQRMFLLIPKHDRDSYWTIPKRHFSTSDTTTSFRTLLNKKARGA